LRLKKLIGDDQCLHGIARVTAASRYRLVSRNVEPFGDDLWIGRGVWRHGFPRSQSGSDNVPFLFLLQSLKQLVPTTSGVIWRSKLPVLKYRTNAVCGLLLKCPKSDRLCAG
jgi:hypothetical protein